NRLFVRVLSDERARPEGKRLPVHDLIERDLTDTPLEFDALRAVERIGDDARRAPIGLTEEDRFVDHCRLARNRGQAALNPAAQIWDLPRNHAPVPALRLVEVPNLRGGVLEAEAPAHSRA